MSIFAKLTLKTLKENKIRTLVTIIGVILSAAMITAVATLITSFHTFLIDSTVYTDGDWYYKYMWMDETETAEIKKAAGDTPYFSSYTLGYAPIENRENAKKPYLYIEAGDAEYFRRMPVHLISGRLPESSSEIILPNHLAENGGVKHILGEVITLNIGERVVGDRSRTMQGLGFQPNKNDRIVNTSPTTFKIVGFYERPRFEYEHAPGYTALTFADGAEKAQYTSLFFKPAIRDSKELEYALYDVEDDVLKVYEEGSTSNMLSERNGYLLMYSGAPGERSFELSLYAISAVLIALIMFASISLIYNAFAVSVSSRTKQFGLLSSIGATKKQLRKIVRWEGLFVSLIGIPLGILAGLGGVWVTLLYLGDKFVFFVDGSHALKMTLKVSPLALIAAFAVSFLTVMISAHIPSHRATRASAIDAIRGDMDIKIKEKPIKSSRLVYKLFGFEGMLAQKYFKRSKKQYRPVILSLIMSVVLLISSSSLTMYLTKSINDIFNSQQADVVYSSPHVQGMRVNEYTNSFERTKKLFAEAQKIENVDDSAMFWHIYATGVFMEEYYSDDYYKYLEKIDEEPSSSRVSAGVTVLDDESFAEYAKECGLRDTEKAIVCDLAVKLPSGDEFNTKYHTLSLLGSIPEKIRVSGNDDKEVQKLSREEIMALSHEQYSALLKEFSLEIPLGVRTDKLPFGFSGNRTASARVFIAESSKAAQALAYYGGMYQVALRTENHIEVYKNLESILTQNSFYDGYAVDQREETDREKNILTIANVLAGGFIALISLIAVANVFNTISTNVALRRREFAMLRSVGITKKGLRKIMAYECINYGLKSLLWALPISLIVTVIIHFAVGIVLTMPFMLPWGAVIGAVVGVFAVAAITMVYAITKIEKENPIDSLKNENI